MASAKSFIGTSEHYNAIDSLTAFNDIQYLAFLIKTMVQIK